MARVKGSRGLISSWGNVVISWLLSKNSQFFQGLWPLACGCPHSSVDKPHTHMYTSGTNWIQKVTKKRAWEGNAGRVREKSGRVEIVKYIVNIYLSLCLSLSLLFCVYVNVPYCFLKTFYGFTVLSECMGIPIVTMLNCHACNPSPVSHITHHNVVFLFSLVTPNTTKHSQNIRKLCELRLSAKFQTLEVWFST